MSDLVSSNCWFSHAQAHIIMGDISGKQQGMIVNGLVNVSDIYFPQSRYQIFLQFQDTLKC